MHENGRFPFEKSTAHLFPTNIRTVSPACGKPRFKHVETVAVPHAATLHSMNFYKNYTRARQTAFSQLSVAINTGHILHFFLAVHLYFSRFVRFFSRFITLKQFFVGLSLRVFFILHHFAAKVIELKELSVLSFLCVCVFFGEKF